MKIITGGEYQWNQGWANPIAHTDVNAVVEELKQIQEVRGEITPEFVVESAKNKNSVLHKYFIWDDAIAANKYRVLKAGEIIQRIELKIVNDGEARIYRAIEVSSKNSNTQSSSYKLFDGVDSTRAKSVAITGLKQVINRLSPFDEYAHILKHLNKALYILCKESTEMKSALELKTAS